VRFRRSAHDEESGPACPQRCSRGAVHWPQDSAGGNLLPRQAGQRRPEHGQSGGVVVITAETWAGFMAGLCRCRGGAPSRNCPLKAWPAGLTGIRGPHLGHGYVWAGLAAVLVDPDGRGHAGRSRQSRPARVVPAGFALEPGERPSACQITREMRATRRRRRHPLASHHAILRACANPRRLAGATEGSAESTAASARARAPGEPRAPLSRLPERAGRVRRPRHRWRGDDQGGAPVRGVRDRVLVRAKARTAAPQRLRDLTRAFGRVPALFTLVGLAVPRGAPVPSR
jgi:hypothetical protein